MRPIHYLGLTLVIMAGCQGLPTVTRTGDVKDIIIGDDLTAAEISVNPGDEVRWINKRTAPVRIVFLDPVSDKKLSCRNNFGAWMGPTDTAKLATNETASACFRDAGFFRYTLRLESGLTTGEINVPGVIQVGGTGGQAAAQTRDQTGGHTSGQTPNRGVDQKNDPARDVPAQAPINSTSTTTTTTTSPVGK